MLSALGLGHLVPVGIVDCLHQVLLEPCKLPQLLVQPLHLFLEVYVNSQLQEDPSRSEVGNSTSLRDFFLVVNDKYLRAFSKGSEKVSLLSYHFLLSKQVGVSTYLWRQVYTGGNGAEATCNFIDLLELVGNAGEVGVDFRIALADGPRVAGNGDGLGFAWEGRQFLVELFTDEGHQGMEAEESLLEAGEQSKGSEFLFFLRSIDKDRLRSL